MLSTTVDLLTRTVQRPDGPQTLTTTEARLLEQLVSRSGRAASGEELLLAVWGRGWDGTPEELRPVRTTISRLRQKIELDPRAPRHILTDQGDGYRWAPGDPQARPARRFSVAPGEPYHDGSYIPRLPLEASCLDHLNISSQPLVLIGGWKQGKTWLGERVLARCRALGNTTARLNARSLEQATVSSPAELLHFLAHELGDAVGLEAEEIEAGWSAPGTPPQKLKRLVERKILPAAGGRFVLWVDDADRLARHADYRDFFAMLRGWAEEQRPIWSHLRLFLTTTTDPSRLISHLHSSPFNIGQEFVLGGWPEESLAGWPQAGRLFEAFTGHPYWTRALIWEARDDADAISEMLARLDHTDGPLEAPLRAFRAWMEAQRATDDTLPTEHGLPSGVRQLLQRG